MDSSFSVSSRKSNEMPKPETGLAEWTSKIKALQRQVDADEEDEQKRLEEEIAAARQARLRRSRGMGGGSRADSMDFAHSREQLGLSDNPADMSSSDAPKSFSERDNDRDTALRKLMERNSVHNPDKTGAAVSSKSPPSLASFIGGHASGPRLNKHAPQQDAHDPTQFNQPDLSAPHPVFGSGGVAMPGMAPRREGKSPGPIRGSDLSERYRPSSVAASKSTSAQDDLLGTPTVSNKETNRRSFSATPKSPSTALASRYAEKFNAPDVQEAKPSTDPVVVKRKSYQSVKSPSPQPPPAVEYEPVIVKKKSYTSILKAPSPQPPSIAENPPTQPVIAKKKSFPSTAKSTPAPQSVVTPSKPIDFSRSTSSATPSKAFSSYTAPSYLSTTPSATNSPKVPTPSKSPSSYVTPSYLGTANTAPTPSGRSGSIAPSTKGETPLHRLMERNNVHNPDKLASNNARQSVAERAQTTSLAAFMGAPGKGIRLNKHAPQADAHDPTQFTQTDTNAPHPVFGKGGIAMPGMVTRKSAPESSHSIDDSGLAKPSSTKKATWPPVNTASLDRPVSPQKVGQRERTISAPRADSPISRGHISTSSRGSNRSTSPSKSSRIRTPVRDRTISTPATSAARSALTTVSLARPKQPEPTQLFVSPQIPTTNVSPAFLKPAEKKDLTPSLSRLQGRGFVQNMVKTSANLSGSPAPTTPSPGPTRPSSAGAKRSTVLDRWQQNAQATSPSKSSQTPSSNPTKRTTTGSSSHPNGAVPSPLKSTPSLPSMATSPEPELPKSPQDPYPRSRTPGLGSATTMVVIKPRKSFTDLTELGMKPTQSEVKHPSRSPSPRKPLIHLTKDRAKKPGKGRRDEDKPDSELDTRATDFEDAILRTPVSQSAPASRTTFDISMPNDPKPTRSPSPKKQARLTVETELKGDTREALVSPKVSSPLNISKPGTPEPLAWSPAATGVKTGTPPTPTKERIGMGLPSGSPAKHVRIPSTGNRATVMEVAQAFNEISPPEPELVVQPEVIEAESPLEEDLPPLPEPVARPRPNVSQIHAEKRRSTYERYSVLVLPPLKEEATPTPSPAGTLKQPEESKQDIAVQRIFELQEEDLQEPPSNPQSAEHADLVLVVVDDSPPVKIDSIKVHQLLVFRPQPRQQSSDQQTISVDVLSIVANAAITISKDYEIFFENEILAVVHRVKSKSSGLATTSVWCWLGRQTQLGDKEEKKIQELAKRYGTSAKFVHQLSEPAELVGILGGRLAIRQGSRNHWSAENTTMHLVRSLNGVILVDEHDLNIKNLCSAFSYCFTLLGSIYIWHGCGSTPKEREAASEYAKTLSPDPVVPIELIEGVDDDDEMFWMMLGDDDFARAEYWRWRHAFTGTDPSIWRIDISHSNLTAPVEFISAERNLRASVYVINCIWELFVLVGKEARGQRQIIRTALQLAQKLSEETASERPFKPPVHVLVLPSQLPIDLRLGIRDFDEAWLNDGDIPDHLHLISCVDAENQLQKSAWTRDALKDPDMMPLGVGKDHLTA